MYDSHFFLFVIHLAVTLFMTTVVWFVQLVHYPLFYFIGPHEFRRYMEQHQRRAMILLVPIMMIELSTAILLPIAFWPMACALWLLNLFLLILIWMSTFAIQGSLHAALLMGRDDNKIAQLIRSNWLRTVLWTFRALVVLGIWSAYSIKALP